MTREQIDAVEQLKKYTDTKKNTDKVEISVLALNRIINALSQEPCEDCISREAVDNLSRDLVHVTRDKADFLCNFWEGLNTLPSVKPQEPKTDWIPVSERLPEKNMSCLVTVGKLNLVQIAMYSDLMKTINHRIFYQGNYGKDDFRDITQYVKAWMPLPSPYEPQESEVKHG